MPTGLSSTAKPTVGHKTQATLSPISNPSVTPITHDTANTWLSGTMGTMQHYVLDMPTACMEIECIMSSKNGDADIYMHVGAEASPTSNDCSSTGPTSNELCTIIVSLSTTKAYAAVDAYVAYANLTFSPIKTMCDSNYKWHS
jgi:hypothetical protein